MWLILSPTERRNHPNLLGIRRWNRQVSKRRASPAGRLTPPNGRAVSGPHVRTDPPRREPKCSEYRIHEPDWSRRRNVTLLMIFPTATTRNSCPTTASSTASVCPGLAAGTRFPYPTVVIVTKLKNRSWLRDPFPSAPKNGMLPNSPAAL